MFLVEVNVVSTEVAGLFVGGFLGKLAPKNAAKSPRFPPGSWDFAGILKNLRTKSLMLRLCGTRRL